AKIKGDTVSGSDINTTVVGLMAEGTKSLQTRLADAHGQVNEDGFGMCFLAARRAYPAAKAFEIFSPYLTAKGDEKKKKRDPAVAKRERLCEALGLHSIYGSHVHALRDEEPPLDPRWLDAAVQVRHLGLVRSLIRPGHAGANALLSETFADVLKKAKSLNECHEVVAAMVYAQHPEATDAFIA